ncbi:MAG: hypothetical protein AAFQ51_00220 [Pseudomonadota bacterium]
MPVSHTPRGPARPRGAALLTLALLAAAPAAAQRADAPGFSLSLGQNVAYSTNRGLSDPADAPRLSSVTTLDARFTRDTGRDSLTLSGGAGVSLAAGDDVEDTAVPVAPRLSLDYARRAAVSRLSLGGDLRVDRVEEQSLVLDTSSAAGSGTAGDLRLTQDEGLQIDGSLRAGYAQDLDALNTLDFGARLARRDFVDVETADGSTDAGLTAGWSRRLSPLLSGSLSAGLNQVISEAANADSRRASLNAGLSWQESETRRFSAGLGLVVVDADGEEDLLTRVSGNLRAAFAPSPLDAVQLGFDQGVTPGAEGALVTRSAASADWTRQLTRADSLTLALGATRQTDLSGDAGDTTFWRAGASVTREFSRGARVTVGYSFRDSTDAAEPSHTVRLGLSLPLYP